jgi:hypothetical protein
MTPRFVIWPAAEACVSTLGGIWTQVEGTLRTGPRVCIVDRVEEHED